MKFDKKIHGEGTRETGGESTIENWRLADETPVPDAYPEARWVPVETIWERDEVQPRATDGETVEAYADNFDALPPVTVRRGDFALIDGWHRVNAAPVAMRRIMLVQEVDCADEDLAVTAFLANLENGRNYTAEERWRGFLLLEKTEPYRSMPAYKLAKYVGVGRKAIGRVRKESPSQQPIISSDGRVMPSVYSPRQETIKDIPLRRPLAPEEQVQGGERGRIEAKARQESSRRMRDTFDPGRSRDVDWDAYDDEVTSSGTSEEVNTPPAGTLVPADQLVESIELIANISGEDVFALLSLGDRVRLRSAVERAQGALDDLMRSLRR